MLGPGSSARFSRSDEMIVALVSARPSRLRLRGLGSPFARPTEDARFPMSVDRLPTRDGRSRPESVTSYIDWCRDIAATVDPSSSMTLRGGLSSSDSTGTADADRELRCEFVVADRDLEARCCRRLRALRVVVVGAGNGSLG